MALPLYLAITAAEISTCGQIPGRIAWMSCHFAPCGQGLSNIPTTLPPGAMLMLNDRQPIHGHSADLVAGQLAEAVERLKCESVLLDFQRPPVPESIAIVQSIQRALPCPVAVSDGYAKNLECPVFLSPPPLHIPLEAHLAVWSDREIWLEAALCQEQVTVTASGTVFMPQFPTDVLAGGFYNDALRCRYHSQISNTAVKFTLFDTAETLKNKLNFAQTLGVTRAVGLFQELGT